jgi:hypothetical protein
MFGDLLESWAALVEGRTKAQQYTGMIRTAEGPKRKGNPVIAKMVGGELAKNVKAKDFQARRAVSDVRKRGRNWTPDALAAKARRSPADRQRLMKAGAKGKEGRIRFRPSNLPR